LHTTQMVVLALRSGGRGCSYVNLILLVAAGFPRNLMLLCDRRERHLSARRLSRERLSPHRVTLDCLEKESGALNYASHFARRKYQALATRVGPCDSSRPSRAGPPEQFGGKFLDRQDFFCWRPLAFVRGGQGGTKRAPDPYGWGAKLIRISFSSPSGSEFGVGLMWV
jgi:hypothetical protein